MHLGDLAIPNLPRLCFQYRQQELTYAATPYLLAHLLERGFAGACFFKQESLVLNAPNREGFVKWAATAGVRELGIHESFIPLEWKV